jgi:hypothetical protein
VPAKPAHAQPNVRAVGVAIGQPVAQGAALGMWQQLAARIGTKLVGASPLLAEAPGGGKMLIAGPVENIAAANKLCQDIESAGIACAPSPYVGSELPAATGSPFQ